MAKASKRANDKPAKEEPRHKEAETTRSDVASDANPAVDATRVHPETSSSKEGEELNADNAEELLTENEIAKRNREVGNIGTRHEGDNETDVAEGFNK